MIETSRKVELVAAALYVGSFVLLTLVRDEPEPDSGMRCVFCLEFRRLLLLDVSGRVYAALALLLVAVGLTVAAVRLRRSSPHNS